MRRRTHGRQSVEERLEDASLAQAIEALPHARGHVGDEEVGERLAEKSPSQSTWSLLRGYFRGLLFTVGSELARALTCRASKLADPRNTEFSGMLFTCTRPRLLFLALGLLPFALARAEPVELDLPAQPADSALLALCKQTKIEVLFSFDDLHRVQSSAVTGRYEPAAALDRLLQGTGFAARPNGHGKYVITPAAPPTGGIKGRRKSNELTLTHNVEDEP